MEEKSTEALNFIKQNPGCKVSDVQKYLNVSRPVIATIIKSLQELGFVDKRQGKGRATALYVTAKGEEFLIPKQASISQQQPAPQAPASEPLGPAAVLTAAPSAQAEQAAQAQSAAGILADPAPSPAPASAAPASAVAASANAPQQAEAEKKKGFWARLRALF